MCAVAVGMCSWYPLASYAAPAAVANAAPGVQPQAATPAAPIVVGEPTATLAEPTAPAAVAENVPQREVKLSFATIAPPPGSIVLRGSRPDASVEFGMRSDELVANALLNLEYTPSPSLLPVQSQLKVYLNDELMGVLPVTKEQLGKKIRAQLPIDPLYITDFNRVRLEFVGHYRDVCENAASSTLWLDVGRESYLDLAYQSLKVNNDLSHFPVPFYDPRDNRPLKLPMIFPGSPAVTQQQAAAIVASWFGSKAGWRGQQFPVYFSSQFATLQEGNEMYGYLNSFQVFLEAAGMFCAPWLVNRIGAKNALLTAGMIMSVRILGSSFASSAVEVVILKMLHMFEIPFLLVGTFKYISSAFNPRLSATLFLIGFNLSKQLSGVVLSAWVGRMYDTVGFHQAYLILGCITLSFTLLSFVTLRGGNRLLPTAETQSPA